MCSQDLTIVDIASMGYVNWFCNDGNPKLVRISKKLFFVFCFLLLLTNFFEFVVYTE